MNKASRIQYLIALYCSIVRYYDYSLFGLSAATLSNEFIKHRSDTSNLLGFFCIFSFSMIARPIGSIILGTIADKETRNKAARLSAILGAIATSVICVIPSYKILGFMSTIILILCRTLFLFSLAGETDAIKIYVAEIFKDKKYLAVGTLSFTSQIGVLFATYMYHISTSNNQSANLWRINFLLGGVMGLFSVYLRFKFKDNFSQKKDANQNYIEIFSISLNYKIKFLLSLIINGSIGGLYNFFIIFLHVFILKMQTNLTQEIDNVKIIIAYSMACIISGCISDFIVPKRQMLLSLAMSIFIIIFGKLIIKNISFSYIHLILVFLLPFYAIPLQLMVQDFFPANIRVRMCSLAHSFGSMIISSTTPFFCMFIWHHTESLIFVSMFPVLLLSALVVTIFVAKTT